MKQFKKLFAGVLALCMLFTFMPAAMAEAEVGSISGDTKLFAPPVGQYSAVPYVLKDASGNVVEDAVFTITGTHTGVSIDGNKLILDGTNIKSNGVAWSSEFKLSATSSDGSVTAGPIDIDIYENRVYIDLENAAANDNPNNAAKLYKRIFPEAVHKFSDGYTRFAVPLKTTSKEEAKQLLDDFEMIYRNTIANNEVEMPPIIDSGTNIF